MKRTIIQWAVITAIVLVGFIGFILIAGDEDPFNPMPMIQWLLVKGLGLALIGLAALAGHYANRKGLLPDIEEED